MMLYPPMSDLLRQIPSRYKLVNVVAQQARKIAQTAEDEGYPLEEKPVTMALRQLAEGQLVLPED